MLSLYSIQVTPTRLDPDRERAERVRAVVGRHMPVAAVLNYYGNIDAHLLKLVDAASGYASTDVRSNVPPAVSKTNP